MASGCSIHRDKRDKIRTHSICPAAKTGQGHGPPSIRGQVSRFVMPQEISRYTSANSCITRPDIDTITHHTSSGFLRTPSQFMLSPMRILLRNRLSRLESRHRNGTQFNPIIEGIIYLFKHELHYYYLPEGIFYGPAS